MVRLSTRRRKGQRSCTTVGDHVTGPFRSNPPSSIPLTSRYELRDHGRPDVGWLRRAEGSDGPAGAHGRSMVLFDVNLSVPKGGAAAIMGHNVAGKTTLLRVAVGLIRAGVGSHHGQW